MSQSVSAFLFDVSVVRCETVQPGTVDMTIDPNDPPKLPADPEPIEPETPQEDPAEEPTEDPESYPSEVPRFDEPFLVPSKEF